MSHFSRPKKTLRRSIGALIGSTVVFSVMPLFGTERDRRCPTDMVQTGVGTCIDRYEYPNVKGQKPAVGLSGLPEHRDDRAGIVMDITTLCEAQGKRVCTRSEWVAACKGKHGARYPWGNTKPTPGAHECNTDKLWRHPNEKKIAERDEAEMRKLDQSEPVGNRPMCVSASGAHDMIGNVEEWVTCPGVGTHGWCLQSRHWAALVTCDYSVTVHHPRWHYYETGGRCCKDAG